MPISTISISYCGGCNAGYDRVEFINKLLAAVKASGKEIELVDKEAVADLAIVMAGCQALCVADRFDLGGLADKRHVVGPFTFDAVKTSHDEAFEKLYALIVDK